jgi:hypothetical protein
MMQILALFLVTAVLASPADAGNSRRLGTAGAQELRIPVGTRGVALGGATVSSSHGIESLYYNPAGTSSLLGTEASFSNTNYLADMKVRYFALATRQYIGVFAVHAKVLDLGDLYVTTEDAPEGTGEVASLTFATIGLSYARPVTDAIGFGLTANFVNESVLSSSAQGVAFDMGLQYDAQRNGMKFGLVMKNIGPNMQFSGSDFEYTLRLPGDDPQAANRTVTAMSSAFELPSYFQMGGEIRAWQKADSKVTAFGCFQSNNFSQDELRGGVEYDYQDLVLVRGGYMYADQDEYLYGPTFGVGFHLPLGTTNLKVDYALQAVDSYFDDLHTFSATFSF